MLTTCPSCGLGAHVCHNPPATPESVTEARRIIAEWESGQLDAEAMIEDVITLAQSVIREAEHT
jgi:hypothetical protein